MLIRHVFLVVASLAVLFVFLLSPVVVTGQSNKLRQEQDVQSRILGGDATEEHEAVGIVGSRQRGGFCTGTLISPSHVLTAAHCAAEIEDGVSGTFEILGRSYATSEVIIHPDFDDFNFDNDIAILVLSEQVEVVKPSPVFRDIPQVGDVLFIVGFGGTGSPVDGSDGSFGIKREGITTIDEVQETLINWKFDDPNENNTAAGDSGGPGYLDNGMELAIASIASGGTEPDSSLGDCAFNTRVDVYVDWIDRVVSTTPTQEPDDPVLDDPVLDDPADEGPDPMAIALNS